MLVAIPDAEIPLRIRVPAFAERDAAEYFFDPIRRMDFDVCARISVLEAQDAMIGILQLLGQQRIKSRWLNEDDRILSSGDAGMTVRIEKAALQRFSQVCHAIGRKQFSTSAPIGVVYAGG